MPISLEATPATSRRERLLLLCGLAGSVLFNGTWIIDGCLRPGYNHWREPISALSLGPGGWVQRANFMVFGVLLMVFAAGMRAALGSGRCARLFPALQALSGAGLIVAGLFTMTGPGAPWHNVGAYTSFLSRVLAGFVLALPLADAPAWRGWATYSVLTSLGMMLALATFGIVLAHQGPAGVFEKLSTLLASLFTILLVTRLLQRDGRISPGPNVRRPQAARA